MVGIGAAITAFLGLLLRSGIWKDVLEIVLRARSERAQEAREVRRAEADILQADASAQAELHKEFGEEFSYDALSRNRWDSFWDGVNRMPRPLYALSLLWLFYWCVWNPEGFERAMQALERMPAMGWVCILAVIGFYFHGKLAALAQANIPTARVRPTATASGDDNTRQSIPAPSSPQSRSGSGWRAAWRAAQAGNG